MTVHQPSRHAARLGEPSYVWRAGQERRLAMVAAWGQLDRARSILDVGTGLGLYLARMKALAPHVERAIGTEYEFERAHEANLRNDSLVSAEMLPFPSGSFDLVLSHEVLEHVGDDNVAAAEIVRVLRPGGRAIIFVPNRWWPFETHGIYWRGEYQFGNKLGVNYLPMPIRDRFAPHVRTYSGRDLRRLFDRSDTSIVQHSQVFPGYDNVVQRRPALGRIVKAMTYTMERTPLRVVGLSHFMVVEKR